MAEETVNPDGTFDETPPVNDTFADGEEGAEGFEEAAEKVAEQGIDPAFLFLGVVAVIVLAYYFLVIRKKEKSDDDFFSNLDGEKVSLALEG